MRRQKLARELRIEFLERRALLAADLSPTEAATSMASSEHIASEAVYCQPEPEVRVRLQAVDSAGEPVTRLNVGDDFHVQVYVQDTRNGIPEGVNRALVDLWYDNSLVSVAGEIEHGNRFVDYRVGDAAQSGLINDAGGSLWHEHWVAKADPGEEDLLFQLAFTAESEGLVTFLSGAENGHIGIRNSSAVHLRDIDFGQLQLAIGADAELTAGESERLCQPWPDMRVRLQAVDEVGTPLTNVQVGQSFYLETYVQDTRRGIPHGVVSASVDVAYPPSLAEVTGEIEFGDRFVNHRGGDVSRPGLINDAGASLTREFWTDKENPGEEDLLFRVPFTAVSDGSLTFYSGIGVSRPLLYAGLSPVRQEIEFGQWTMSVGPPTEAAPIDSAHFCQPRTDARVRLQAVDLTGKPVSEVAIGEEFYLQGFVQDTRNGIPIGVASAEFDVHYDPTLLSVVGDLQHGERFPATRGGSTSRSGLLDNIAGSSGGAPRSSSGDLGDEELLFQIQFKAEASGQAAFQSGTLQGTAHGGITLWGGGHLTHRQIDFGRLALGIGQQVEANGQAEPPCQTHPDVRVRLQTVDEQFNPVTQVEPGQPFYLQVYVQDARPSVPRGVVFAEVDVAYDASLAAPSGDLEFGDRFPNSRGGDISKAGLINNAGASLWRDFWTDKDDPGEEDLLFQVRFTAVGTGAISFRSGPASTSLRGDIMLRDASTPSWRETEFGTLEIAVAAEDLPGDGQEQVDEPPSLGTDSRAKSIWQNAELESDVNADGAVTPVDALLLINTLNQLGSRLLSDRPEGDAPYYDTNGDGQVSPRDVLKVINVIHHLATLPEGEAAREIPLVHEATSNPLAARFSEVRSHTVRDESSPRPIPGAETEPSTGAPSHARTLAVNHSSGSARLRHEFAEASESETDSKLRETAADEWWNDFEQWL